MEEKKAEKDKTDGCLKSIGLGAAIILGIAVLAGAIEGIGELFAQIPWYGHVVLSIGFIYLMYNISKHDGPD